MVTLALVVFAAATASAQGKQPNILFIMGDDTIVPDTATGGLFGATSFHWTQLLNLKRDPFEQTVGADAKSLLGYGGALGSPGNAYIYNWNMLPIGQLLWEKELVSYKEFPPMQAPETYNLDGILNAMQKSGHNGRD